LECEDPVSVRVTEDIHQRIREIQIRYSGSTDKKEQRIVLVSMDEDKENRQLWTGYFYNRGSYGQL